eukprot:g81987.t1
MQSFILQRSYVVLEAAQYKSTPLSTSSQVIVMCFLFSFCICAHRSDVPVLLPFHLTFTWQNRLNVEPRSVSKTKEYGYIDSEVQMKSLGLSYHKYIMHRGAERSSN